MQRSNGDSVRSEERLIVTTSWDDGYPADRKIAELLSKYGVAGTFYVPTHNAEGRAVLSMADVARLSERFEIGGHSVDHVVLTGLEDAEAERQIVQNKRDLERATGKAIVGFCYVRGRYNASVKDAVRRAGFAYARTVENFHSAVPPDPFELPTTIQLYPHSSVAYLKMFANGGFGLSRARLMAAAVTSGDLVGRMDTLVRRCQGEGGYFHLWGHSWELEELDLWGVLESVLARLAATPGVEFMSNHQVVQRAGLR
jgi:hypothetical protein